MPTESGERRAVARGQSMAAMGTAPEPEQHLPCPRCDSTNTKFCYYNNYNLSQPRHFCKACRRYWTQGGTLRNVPVGGGTRKSSKRSRATNASAAAPTSNATSATSSGSSSGGGSTHQDSAHAAAAIANTAALDLQMPSPMLPADTTLPSSGSFSSLLNPQGSSPSGFLALGGFGLGIGSGYEEMGFGLGRGMWPYPEVGMIEGGNGGCGGGGGTPVGGPMGWQLGGGGDENGFGDGECGFAWPDLAISMSGKGFK